MQSLIENFTSIYIMKCNNNNNNNKPAVKRRYQRRVKNLGSKRQKLSSVLSK